MRSLEPLAVLYDAAAGLHEGTVTGHARARPALSPRPLGEILADIFAKLRAEAERNAGRLVGPIREEQCRWHYALDRIEALEQALAERETE